MLAVAGLFVALFAWIGAMLGIVWTRKRHGPIVVAAGVDVRREDRQTSVIRVARRHTAGWTALFVTVFLALALTGFPLWQRVLFALVLAVFYGLDRIRRGEANRIGRDEPSRVALFGETRDRVWYRLLAICEWGGYLVSLVFLTDLLAQAAGR